MKRLKKAVHITIKRIDTIEREMMMAMISVIVPVYNGEQTIKKALLSILGGGIY